MRAAVRKWIATVLGVASAVLGLLVTHAPPAVAALQLPPGFVLLDRSSGLAQQDLITDFEYLPDGSVLSIGKNGAVAWSSVDGSSNRRLATIPVVTDQDLGLIGLTLAHDYAVSGHIYVTAHQRVGAGVVNRVLRWTVSGSPTPTGLTDQRVILEMPGDYPVHGLWNVTAVPDGSLWISNGDNADFNVVDPKALRAQDLDLPDGKLLHILPDGRGLPSNPFYDAANPHSWRSRVYAYGLRSPLRLSFDPGSGAPILGDVGWTRWEEILVVRPGANYGWPCWEGNERTPGYRDLPSCAGVSQTPPTWAYPHVNGVGSVTGGIVYNGSSYPAAYRGAYFFGDYALSWLSTMQLGADGSVVREPEPNQFGRSVGGPVSFRAGPNGDIVFADIYSGKLRRLSYLPGNRPPTAAAATSTNPGTRTVSFDGSGSYDLDADSLSYRWDFGDGTPVGSGVTATHTYPASPARFTARLTVTDPAGAADSVDITIAPSNAPPVLTMTAPGEDTTFAVGEDVVATAAASDAEDGVLTGDIQWTTTAVHCGTVPGSACHDHPGAGAVGPSFRQPFTSHGDNTRLRITATVTDGVGVSTSRSFTAAPRLRALTLTSNTPATMTIAASEVSRAQVTANATISFSAPNVAVDGVATFDGWSDGGGQVRTGFTMPDSDVTLAATYRTPIDRRYAADPALRSTVGEPAGAEQGTAQLRWRDYAAGRVYWTPATGVHEVHGGIRYTYLAQGGHEFVGAPTNDETATPDGVGRYNDFTGTLATGKASVYWSPATDAHLVYGAIRVQWERLGLTTGLLGFPITSELGTPDGIGRYNHFANGGSIYWHPAWGAYEVHGAIRAHWERHGWEVGRAGYPVTDELGTPDGVGRFNHFNRGASIYWTPSTGAHLIYGSIRDKWASLGWETGRAGYPVTDELGTPDGVGRYNHFNRGASIYWTPATGAHLVLGAIRARWAALGWERSYLGYPTSDEFAIPNGARTNFQRGYIEWYTNGTVIDRRY